MSAQLSSFTSLSFPCISEEAVEDAEGPSEASADPEELAKDQGSGSEEGQSKRAGTVHRHPQPLDLVPGRDETGTLHLAQKCAGSGLTTEGIWLFYVCLLVFVVVVVVVVTRLVLVWFGLVLFF